ncbi:hypothetical protein VRY85_06750 [Achromobacter sp. F4_2707]|uniref:hypothetical protein n=1 Tax=Achromobacter sp. F4_2707 TaxID=3114286 RepID=UPI0039C742F7
MRYANKFEEEQIRREFAKAARATDAASERAKRNAARSSKSGTWRLPVAFKRRAPSSSSQFHFNRKYSNRKGQGGRFTPTSALRKIRYDFGMDERDDGRVDFIHVSHSHNTPRLALDPELVAIEAERTAGRQSNSRQMSHDTIALPDRMTTEGRRKLAIEISDAIREKMDGVPVFFAIHQPDAGKRNWHMHLSHPLREIISTGDDGFKMGDRILYEQRPAIRAAAGLPKTNHSELRQLRASIAGLIADALAKEGMPHHHCERWRHGHLQLHQQVEKAAERGDVDFVLDQMYRDPTKKEGLDTSKWKGGSDDSRRDAAILHNHEIKRMTGIEVPQSELVTKAAVQYVLTRAEKANIKDPELLRQLMRDHGIKMSWNQNKQGRASGVSFQLSDGPKITGKSAGASLPTIKKRLGLPNTFKAPQRLRLSEEQKEAYSAALKSIPTPKHISDISAALRIRTANDLMTKAEAVAAPPPPPQAAPVAAPAPAAQQDKPRPKRKSNDPAFNKKPVVATTAPKGAGTARAAHGAATTPPKDKDKTMNVNKLLEELSTIQDEPAAIVATQEFVSRGPLTRNQVALLIEEWDNEEATKSGTFDGPHALALERLERLEKELRRHRQEEPVHRETRTTWLGRRVEVESRAHKFWKTELESRSRIIEEAKNEIKRIEAHVATRNDLIERLPALEAAQAARHQEAAQHAQERAESDYSAALETLRGSKEGWRKEAAARTINRLLETHPHIREQEQSRRRAAAQHIRSGQPAPATRQRHR